MTRIALATSSDYPDLIPDDRRLLPLLAARRINAIPAVWNDSSINWGAFDGVLIRSCWDYHLHPQEFWDWVSHLPVPVWNPPSVVQWNMNKIYLRELAEHGIPIVPTIWVQSGDSVDLQALMQTHNWSKAVVKPCISASAYQTWTVTLTEAPVRQLDLNATQTDLMIQRYMPQIVEGEWSLVFFTGVFSHAFLKRPAPGKFFVQIEHGGSESTQPPPNHLIEQASHVLQVASVITQLQPCYARVDGVVEGDQLMLMELELIEPALFTADSPEHTFARFADVIRECVL